MRRLTIVICAFIVSIGAFAQSPRYIFYFIGDGMGPEQVFYGGGDSLNFTKFPVIESVSTFSASDSVTDSAAAGTALATARKTSNGTIGMNYDHSQNFYSIAVDARKTGRKVGILTSVSIDHATPAAFYAHNKSRKNYHQIATWLPVAGFDLYAGAGFLEPKDGLFQTFKDSSYNIIRGAGVLPGRARRTIWIQDTTFKADQLPYSIERKGGELTLPIMVDGAIKALQCDDDGFFIMAEGGKIDWACHANNAAQLKGEVKDLDDAVAYAIKFYYEHPLETLIVVTADHETGGLNVQPDYSTTWRTKNHTATRVPLYVMGFGAEHFSGVKDNTDIARTIRKLL